MALPLTGLSAFLQPLLQNGQVWLTAALQQSLTFCTSGSFAASVAGRGELLSHSEPRAKLEVQGN